jgi:hypothetical protein
MSKYYWPKNIIGQKMGINVLSNSIELFILIISGNLISIIIKNNLLLMDYAFPGPKSIK